MEPNQLFWIIVWAILTAVVGIPVAIFLIMLFGVLIITLIKGIADFFSKVWRE